MNTDELKNRLNNSVAKVESEDWVNVQIDIRIAPFSTPGSKMNFYFRDEDENILKIFAKFDQLFSVELFIFFYENYIELNFNKIIFKAQRGKLQNSTLEFEFDQSIVEEYLSYLPKSKRGKTIPWYEIDDQVKKLKENFETLKSKMPD